jgi:predicted Zn-dependent peptidase
MYRAASVELYSEPYRTLDELLSLIDAITVDDIANVAREFFMPEQFTVVSLGPKGAE